TISIGASRRAGYHATPCSRNSPSPLDRGEMQAMPDPLNPVPDPDTTPKNSGKAVTSPVLRILSFCLPGILSLPAIILGAVALRTIGRSQGQLRGTGLAVAGLGTGICSLVLAVPLGIAVLLMLSVQWARETAERTSSANILYQIGLAAHTHHLT